MHFVSDLHIEKEILPLFDNNLNELSRDRLIFLLTKIPQTIAEVDTRQTILKAMLQHPRLLKPFLYSRVELAEVYHATVNNQERQRFLGQHWVWKYMPVASVIKQREIAKTIQVLSFFKRVHQAYFTELDISLFPIEFKNSLQVIIGMLTRLDVQRYNPEITANFFNTGYFLKVIDHIDQLVSTGVMAECWNTLYEFEAYLSIAKTIQKHGWQFPTFTGSHIMLEDFYHPLLNNPVKNNIDGRKNVTLLTGPNMSGKSTVLRSIGLCVYLAHLGIAVPARRCEMVFYDSISIAIDLADNLQGGYSHFRTEVAALKKVLKEAVNGRRCFAIFDELFRGTNGADALAITAATVKGVAKFKNSCFFISTHLYQLRDSVNITENIGLKNLKCEIQDGQPVFTYQLVEGWSELKIGQLIFEMEGLSLLLNNPSFAANEF